MTFIRCAALRVFLVCCLAIACSVGLLAQGTNARITGIVTDQSKAVIRGARVVAINEDTGVRYPAETNSSGIYLVPSLIPGKYRVEIESIGFKTVIKPGLVLHVQDVAEMNFEMAVGSTSETVTVSEMGVVMNTTDASVGTVVDRNFVENLPLNGRSFQDLISMTPGVVTQSPQSLTSAVGYQGDFSVNGQRTESNYYTVDGVSANTSAGYPNGNGQSATTGSVSSSTAFGTTQSLVSVDALQEFRVTTSSYSAEYGRTPGGQFSLSTRSGTNEFHGSTFDYFRNDALDATDWFNKHNGLKKTALRQNDFGGTLGGPIELPHIYSGMNRSFFFASYEGLRLTQPIAATVQYVPSLAVRASAASAIQPLLNAFPIPTGAELALSSGALSGLAPFLQSYSLPGAIDATSIRLDHSVSSRLSVFFRFSHTPSSNESRTLSDLSESLYTSNTYTLGTTGRISHNLNNETRLSFAASRSSSTYSVDTFGGAHPIDFATIFGVPDRPSYFQYQPTISISGVGTSSVGQFAADSGLHQWNVTNISNLQLGSQILRFGVDYRRLVSPINPLELSVLPVFTSRQQLLTDVTSSTTIRKADSAVPIFNELSLFIQDEWHALRSLTVSAGLRWELNPPPTEKYGNSAYTLLGNIGDPASLTLAPRGTSLWNTTWFNFAPRLGLAWTAHTNPGWETVFRGGGGAFFDTGNQTASLGFNGIGFAALKRPTGVSLPLAANQFDFSTAVVAPYTSNTVYAFPNHMQLPYSLGWNVSVEQMLGKAQAMTISYVASSGRRLLQEQVRSVTATNPNFGNIVFFPNGVTSSYQALQVQFQRSVRAGLQTLVGYTWSHSLDYGSTNISYPLQRGNSDFDVRHNLQAGLSWELPQAKVRTVLKPLTNNWAVDTRLITRTAFPVSLQGNTTSNPVTGGIYYTGVNFDKTRPVYLYSSKYPGGRAINGGANNTNTPAFTLPSGTAQGNAPRNFVRGFGATQLNVAVRKELRPSDKLRVQFRAEAFNLFNHPNFGYVSPTLSDTQFGQATKMLNQSLGTTSSLYQQGGSRSAQLSLKLLF